MLKRIVSCLSLALSLFFTSCDQAEEAQITQERGVRFELETSILDENDPRLITYDPNDSYTTTSGSITAYRPLVGSTQSSHVLIFDNSITPTYGKSNLVGYAQLTWKFVRSKSTSGVVATCYGDYKVYKAEMVASGTQGEMVLSLDKSQEITLTKGKNYRLAGLLTSKPLLEQRPDARYSFMGPNVDLDPSGELIGNMQGEIPYSILIPSVTPQENNYVSMKTGALRLNTVVARIEIDNQSTRTLTSSDIRLNFEGLTSNIKYAFLANSMRIAPTVHTQYNRGEVMTPNNMLLPIQALGAGEKGMYFIPLTLSNGTVNNSSLTHVSISVDSPQSDITIVNSKTNLPFNYVVTGTQNAYNTWINSGAKLKVIKLTVK